MISTSVPLPPAVERLQIHLAVCRARRAGLVCSTCSDFAESAERAMQRLAQFQREAA